MAGESAQCHLNSACWNIKLVLCFGYMDIRWEDALGLYRRCISAGVVEYFQKQAHVKVRRSIYTCAGGDLADDPAMAVAGRNVGNECRSAAGWARPTVAERL